MDDMDHVIEVQKAISNMGYEANSQMEWLEQSGQQSNMIQAALGGIGAVSLLVLGDWHRQHDDDVHRRADERDWRC